MLTSDIKQQGRKKEFEEKENESLMLKQLSSFTNVSHIARGKSSNLRVIVRIGNAEIQLFDCSHWPSEVAWSCNEKYTDQNLLISLELINPI